MVDRNRLPDHIRVLLQQGARPEPGCGITLLQTHISWILLAGKHAYKIKKPVDFGFLDFTTLEKRRQACMDELRLNRRLAPEIYLEVLPVCKKGNDYWIGDNDVQDGVVDYCLKMVQFDQGMLFDRLVSDNRFEPEWMDRLAVIVARFHRIAEHTLHVEAFGTPENLYRHICESLDAGAAHLENPLISNLKKRSRESYERLKDKLLERQRNHHVRDCHGDLHLKNIVLYNDRPTPFDCIEFNDEFRMIDTMNDTAFLVMDCEARGHPELGYRFLSRYLEQAGDYEGLEPLPLYLSYRAGVRGKVACLLADDPAVEGRERQKQLVEAESYFKLAESYLSPPSPKLIAIGGLSGSGKSHLALLALEHEKAVIIRSDATRKRIAADHPSLPLYGKRMHELTYRAMFDAAESALQAGFSIILDATFLLPASRQEAIMLSERSGVPLTFYWLDIDTKTLRKRVKDRSEQSSDISDADMEVLELQLKEYRRPEEPAITYLDNSDLWPGGNCA